MILGNSEAGNTKTATQEIDLFNSIANTDIPDDTRLIRTNGWSELGVGGARYIYDSTIDAEYVAKRPATSTLSKNGRGFKIAEDIISAEMVGASTRNLDNSAALQHGIDEIAMRGGGQLKIPGGIFPFATGLIMRTGVDISGSGKASSYLHFTGDGTAIDAYGTAEQRKVFQIRDLCLLGTRASKNAIAIKLAWNQRSLPLLERVMISDFGHHAILFAGSNWLITFRDIEIHNCAKHAIGSAAIARLQDVDQVATLVDIKFSGLVIESCGSPQSMAGALHFPATPANPTQGLWIGSATIEGNFGRYECAIENADFVSISDSYFEIGNLNGRSRNGIAVSDAHLILNRCRMASDPGNTKGSAVSARGKSVVNVSGNIWDTDFQSADIVREPTVLLEGTDMQISTTDKLRIKTVASNVR
jgi:hypothetical protein